MEIVTLEEIKLQLEIESTNTKYDTLITNITDSIETFVENYTMTSFIPKDSTAVILTNIGISSIYISETPVNSISIIGYDVNLTDGTYDNTYLIGKDVLWQSNGKLFKTDGVFNTKTYVSFNYGYDKPADIKQTIIDAVRFKFRHITENADLIQSKTVGGETTTYNLEDFSITGKEVLKKYKNKNFVFFPFSENINVELVQS